MQNKRKIGLVHRNLSVSAVFFALFSFCALNLGKTFCVFSLILLSIVLLAVIIFSIFKLTGREFLYLWLPALVFSLFAILLVLTVRLPQIDSARELDGQYLRAEGTVISMTSSENHKIFTVKCKGINSTKQNVSLIVRKENCDGIDIGSQVAFSGNVEFSDSVFSKGNECFLSSFPDSFYRSGRPNIFWNIVYNLRCRIRTITGSMNNSAMINALIIGDKSGIDDAVENDFKKLGTSHILAISGLHLAIIVISFYTTVSRFALPHRVSSVLSAVLAFAYMMMTGFSLSLVRSAQMLCVFFFARTIRRSRDGITSLSFAGLFILLLNQWSMYNIGFLLSFMSTLGIIVFASPVSERYWKYFQEQKEKGKTYTRHRMAVYFFLHGILSSVATTVSATVCTLPLILPTFNEISFWGIIGNLAVLPIVKYFLIFAFVTVVFKTIGLGVLAVPLELLTDISGFFFVEASELLGKILPPTFSSRTFYLPFATVCIIVIIAFFFINSHKSWSLPAMALSVSAFLLLFNPVSDAFIYTTAVVDTVNVKGCNTSIVRWKGETYLLDQTDSDSTKMGTIDETIGTNGIKAVDKAVFIASKSLPVSRIKAFLALLKIDEVIVIYDGSDNVAGLDRLCNDEKAELYIISTERYSVSDGLTAISDPNGYTAFLIENGDGSCLVFRSFNEDEYLADARADTVLIGSGKINLFYSSRLENDGHYRIKHK